MSWANAEREKPAESTEWPIRLTLFAAQTSLTLLHIFRIWGPLYPLFGVGHIRYTRGRDFPPDMLHKLCIATWEASCLREIISSVTLFRATKSSLSRSKKRLFINAKACQFYLKRFKNLFVICRQQLWKYSTQTQVSKIPPHNWI